MNIPHNVTKGSLTKGSAMLLILTGALGVHFTKWGFLGFFLTGIPLWCFGILASIGGILFFLGPMIFGSASVGPNRQLSKTPEMLFLYLRPFELDARNTLQLTVGVSTGILVYSGLMEGLWWPVSFLPLAINISKEQGFQETFKLMGEFVAIGKPMEWFQPIGASRVYVTDWQQEVERYIGKARLIIIRPGKSPGIQWEIGRALDPELVPRQRVVFYLRFRGGKKRREEAYTAFRNDLQSLFSAELPKQMGEGSYLIFDKAGNPLFVREANRPLELVRQIFSRSGDITTDRFRPILKALDIEPPVQPSNWFKDATLVFLWLIAAVLTGLVLLAVILVLMRLEGVINFSALFSAFY